MAENVTLRGLATLNITGEPTVQYASQVLEQSTGDFDMVEDALHEKEKAATSPKWTGGPISPMFTGMQPILVQGQPPQVIQTGQPYIAPPRPYYGSGQPYYGMGQPYNVGYSMPGCIPPVYPSTLNQTSFVPDFKGTSGWECEEFIRAIRAKAFADEKDGDEQWMLRLMVAHLSGKALRWYSTLHSSVKGSWEDMVDAMLAEYPTEDIAGCCVMPTPKPR